MARGGISVTLLLLGELNQALVHVRLASHGELVQCHAVQVAQTFLMLLNTGSIEEFIFVRGPRMKAG